MCPDKETLSAYLDGEIDLPWSERLGKHLEGCAHCREYLEGLRRLSGRLRADPEFEAVPSLERLMQRLAVRAVPVPAAGPSLWSRRINLPLPLAAGAGLVILFLSIGLLTLAMNLKSSLPHMIIKKLPHGATEVEVAAPIEDLEKLLKSLDQPAFKEAIVFTLPEDSRFIMAGEPRMLRAEEIPGSRLW